MMLTSKARYAVIAIVDIASSCTKKPVNLSQISSRQNITVFYLEQIFNKLKSCDIVGSVKGPGGGYFLKRPLDQIRIKDIIDAVEENVKITGCNDNLGCIKKSTKCLAHDLFESIAKKISDYLSQISILDVINGKYDVNVSEDVTLDNTNLNTELTKLDEKEPSVYGS